MSRDLDLVLLGATGFTGRLAARELVERAPARGLKVALAARDESKLRALGCAGVELLVVDVNDAASVRAMARRARAVITTVGPYARHGASVVAACVDEGTHYADITGETAWVRDMIDAHHARARDDGTLLVSFCGVDSVPGDLLTWLLARALLDEHGEKLARVHGSLRVKGGYSGGTVATALALGAGGRALRERLDDPFLLVPDESAPAGVRAALADPRRALCSPSGAWEVPYVMALIDGRVVRRTAALFSSSGIDYGRRFHFSEGFMGRRGQLARVRAETLCLAVRAGSRALESAALRSVAARVLPRPGEGPSDDELRAGRTRARFYAEGERGTRRSAYIDYRGDPGYAFTSMCLVTVGLLLAGEAPRRRQGGFLTPAFAFGDRLVERLRERGATLELDP